VKTTVATFANRNALQAAVACSLDNLRWRHAGIGVLQAYLYEGTRNEMRVHVWHPDLKKPGMTDHGDIHDHRFHLRSFVLLGGIEQSEFEIVEKADGDWRCHTVTHAREAEKRTGTFHETDEANDKACDLRGGPVVCIPAGYVYEFPKRAIHRSEPRGLTVTLVEKLNQDDVPARVISLRNAPVVHAFTDTLPEPEFMPFVRMAREALLRAAKEPTK
jgi:hypothetical protein